MNSVLNRVLNLPKRTARWALREGARRSPISSQVLGPPRGVLPSISQWCAQNANIGAEFCALAPEEKSDVAPPIALEEMPKKYQSQLGAKTPPRFVARIPRGRVCYNGIVITPDDYLLGESTYQSQFKDFKTVDWPILRTLKLPTLQKQSGAVGVLTSLWSDNYYHWLFDIVPRLHLLQQSGFAIEKYVVADDKNFQKQTLDLLGISQNQRIADEPNLHLLADQLLVSSLPGGQGNPPRWICEFLRETLVPAAQREYSQEYSRHQTNDGQNAVLSSSPKRIYISRANAGGRRVVNEDEVLQILQARNFESTTLENMSLVQQILLFNGAQAVVAPHGAALSNLVFCRPGTRVLEIFVPGWIHPIYNFVSARSDLRFGCLIGSSARPLPANHESHRNADITVDLRQLEKMLDLLELSN